MASRAPTPGLKGLFVGLLIASLALTGCDRPNPKPPRDDSLNGASAERGQRLMAQYQCGSCHLIPEVPAAAGRVGPSLVRFGARSYIAGRLPVQPDTLAKWIKDPRGLMPDTTMPDMGASTADARDMAAFLLTLQ